MNSLRLMSVVPALLVILLQASCERSMAPTLEQAASSASSTEGCWPIGSAQCEHRDLTASECGWLMQLSSAYANDGVCGLIKLQAQNDLNNSRVKVQTSGIGMNNQYGDRHNAPGISHLTSTYGMANNDSARETLFHESAHGYNPNWEDYEIDILAEACGATPQPF